MYHFARPETQPREQEQNRIITQSDWAGLVTALQQSLDLFGWQELRQIQQPPHGYRGNARTQLGCQVPALIKETQETAQGTGRPLGLPSTCGGSLAENKPGDILGMQFLQPDFLRTEPLGQEIPSHRKVVA